ncbi:NAD-dependent epimerase/dehydratase family protein [Mucilaginibacter paludis]|uniref:NAD-dependent epimerase/dehydratase n=1 Tax=Mucilaginibacter paludis DSM 18603 TaxID=714943 RepID=H1XZP1_9SPHI|nr:NAD(P)-dependent oxidoreductase [Mucilaginibacter paludis]EHQ27733.1 NAD-dependent epimerase/dehydratase [Mucilaginibacter paludis DSM 18603]
MSDTKVFITGGAGFLGSAIIAKLIEGDFKILASRRTQTNLWRCKDFNTAVTWIDTEESTFTQRVIDFQPDIILHSAWNGVTSQDREDWNLQLQNFEFLRTLLQIVKKTKPKKFILLGSQAEYGNIKKRVAETDEVAANSAYAICKLTSQQIVKTFCEQNHINWYWLRVFSVFGPKEDNKWFIPTIIMNHLNELDCNLTYCEQQYDYLYIDDFAAMILRIFTSENSESGIYNICSSKAVPLKNIVDLISQFSGNKSKLNFGVLPYRKDQSMLIEGDNSKFNNTFGKVQTIALSEAIKKTINYYNSVR